MIVRPARQASYFKRAETRSHSGRRACAGAVASAWSSGRVVSAEIARARARALRALVFAGREPGHTRADAAVAGREFTPRAWRAGRFRRCLAPAKHRETPRLVEIGGNPGENLVSLNLIDTVIASLSSIGRTSAAGSCAGNPPSSFSVPPRSRNASSIDTGSTRSVSRGTSARTARPTRYISPFPAG